MSIQANFPAIKPTLLLDFANTEALDPRITFTRASTGTYYDGKTVAKAEENLLLQSQAFDNASWVNSGTITTTANTTAAPDGTITADRLQIAAGNTFKYQNISLISGATYVISVYVMSNTGSNQTFRLFGNDLSSSSADQTATTSWQRFTFTYTASSASSVAVGIRTDIANTAADILVWGAQLEQRASATAYTPTTTQPVTNYIPVLLTAASGVPRFDHNPITGESLGLLIEEQRTNLLLRSEEFDNAAWTKISTTITANTIVAPDGTLTGDKLASSTVSVASHQDYQIGITITNAATYTWSVYMKQGEYAWGIVNAYSATDSRTYFNLATGTVGTVAAGSTATITPVGNGWYRCSVTRTSAASTGGLSIEMTNADNVPSFAAIVGNGIYIWGAQLEAGAFATSYIPTVASQVTRAADSASMTGTNFSSWYNQSEGSIYCESFIPVAADNGPANYYFAISDGTNNNQLLAADVNGTVFQVSTNGSLQFNASVGSEPITFAKMALAYKTNDFIACVNSVLSSADTSGNNPTVNRLSIGMRGDASSDTINGGTIKKLAYYPRRLTNTQLQALTT